MYIKLGNGSFHKKACAAMTFTEFKKNYSGVLTGITLEEAYKAVGGKIRSSKKKKEDEEE